ncbi:MAG: hypothetical protein C4337_01710 [Armatimonadota bacterium]
MPTRFRKTGERKRAVIPPQFIGGYTDPLTHGGSSWYEQVSPIKGRSGRVARPVVVSYPLGWHGVAEPKRREKVMRASGIRTPLN